MSLKFYSDLPGRRGAQLLTDLSVLLWVAAWVWVGIFVHDAVKVVGDVGYSMESGAAGVGSNLNEAGAQADRLPLVGDELASPLTSAGDAANSLADSAHHMGDTIGQLAVILGVVVALAPILSVVLVWAALRLSFARRAGAAAALADLPGGERLLALRALTTRPVRRLARVSQDPMTEWEQGDPNTVRQLAALELARSGVRRR